MPSLRAHLKSEAIHRSHRHFISPQGDTGMPLKVSEYFGSHTFDFRKSDRISPQLKKQLLECSVTGTPLTKEIAEQVADVVTEWAIGLGATHFCHWFQPLTGGTAEKHDAFLDIKDGKAIERLSASQLMQGEPDASSFPSGGSRSTFEARGYTSWDMSSPMFIIDTMPGKTLCIPTAFVSYHGDALDVKTPLLRSIDALSKAAVQFCHLTGEKDVEHVMATCGCEQEYFLVDRTYFFSRPDLVMTGRTLLGASTSKHQQLEDHYFGAIPERVRHFMEELNTELYKQGIPAKTQHNEVAPGQFEIAPIFEEGNIAADHNQLMMALIKNVARRHHFEALLHEKPFSQINGSGKHLNWSMATDTGLNLLEPGNEPHTNHRFLCCVAVILEALKRHGDALRMSIAGHGNDHRLGANEAPPSIISAFIGENLDNIFSSMLAGEEFCPRAAAMLDMGVSNLAKLKKDNTDRNRTSPFAFTGNKFEFRAVGSSQPVGFPLSILNAAVAEVLHDTNHEIKTRLDEGKDIEQALKEVTLHWLKQSKQVIFNGDGYSQEWVQEAEKRGLPNLKDSVESYALFSKEGALSFLTNLNVYSEQELKTRHKVLLKKYLTSRTIEFSTLKDMVYQRVVPAAIAYKKQLSSSIKRANACGLDATVEERIHQKVAQALTTLVDKIDMLDELTSQLSDEIGESAQLISSKLLPLSEEVAEVCNTIESTLPESMWSLPKYYDMLFIN
ncbi:MAG: glutamine synthetase type III [Legionellales bacterium]|nr:glutamine synthetase type III [Legionellales bacterium]